MALTITGIIQQTTPAAEDTSKMGILVKWRISQATGTATEGEAIFEVSQSLTDQEMESEVRQQLAAYVSNLAGVTLLESDVRGCKF